MSITAIISLILIGFSAGLLAGFVGVGGGIIIVPALIFIMNLEPKLAQGTSLALMLPPIGILAFMQYYKQGNVNIPYAIIIAVSFIIGGYFGGKYVQKVDSNLLKLIFAGFMILAAVKLIFSGWKYFDKV